MTSSFKFLLTMGENEWRIVPSYNIDSCGKHVYLNDKLYFLGHPDKVSVILHGYHMINDKLYFLGHLDQVIVFFV
jgi:hypothetical protein